MNDNNPLHWSFDYNYGAQNPQFAQELISTLRGYDPEAGARQTGVGRTVRHVYNILPNYWRGYSRGNATEQLSIGTAIIERSKANNNLWHYSVEYENTTSGENLQMQFRCSDEPYRPLRDSWRVDARNSSFDAYSRSTCDGHLTLDREVKLRINGAAVNCGTVETDVKLTCDWALFDVIPALVQTIQTSDDSVEIAVLEDLEQLRLKSRLDFLESIEIPIPLDGYYLYGIGLLPSYWWLDADGNVAIASSTFETLVLKEKMG
ncbi:hypothetical protein F4Y59_07035 [Candidatus Poribacteria bacterium]|nr:hypothetical protein [Candidatus Poribacteria bacterium]MYK18511.1 hypothetical protein [Candidatus Poribacteria bacterium]